MKKLLILFCGALILSCCKKDPPCYDPADPKCENYDPCFGKYLTADFTINQYTGWHVTPGYEPEFCDTVRGRVLSTSPDSGWDDLFNINK